MMREEYKNQTQSFGYQAYDYIILYFILKIWSKIGCYSAWKCSEIQNNKFTNYNWNIQ